MDGHKISFAVVAFVIIQGVAVIWYVSKLDSKVPQGDLASMWTNYKSSVPLVAPNNKRRIEIIVVGTGLAGASAAATLGELGYKVKMIELSGSSVAVDTPKDLEKVRAMIHD